MAQEFDWLLSSGYYLAPDASELKALRATCGDPRRRSFVQGLRDTLAAAWVADVGESWVFLQEMFLPLNNQATPEQHMLCNGKAMHRGDMYWIMLLDTERVPVMADVLEAVDREAARSLFFGLDVERLQYTSMHVAVVDAWEALGRPSPLSAAREAEVWRDLEAVRRLMRLADDGGRRVLFCCDHTER